MLLQKRVLFLCLSLCVVLAGVSGCHHKKHHNKNGTTQSSLSQLVPVEVTPGYKIQTYHDFDRGTDHWHSYDYNGGQKDPAGNYNYFLLTVWDGIGGVGKPGRPSNVHNGYITTNDFFWRIDTPEKPHSILALINYHYWDDAQTETPDGKKTMKDWRNAKISVYFKGHNLDMKGGKLYFWMMGGDKCGAIRYHLVSHPLTVHNDDWGSKQEFFLKPDEALWHRSSSGAPNCQPSVDEALHYTTSYGFSFLGFSKEVTGKLSMDEFKVEVPDQSTETANSGQGNQT